MKENTDTVVICHVDDCGGKTWVHNVEDDDLVSFIVSGCRLRIFS